MLAVASMDPRKNFSRLVEAFKEISEHEPLGRFVVLGQLMEKPTVGSITGYTDMVWPDKRIPAQDFLFGEVADGYDVLGGFYGQRRHHLIPPVISLGKPTRMLKEREVVDGHHLMGDENRAESCETEDYIVFLADKEKRQDALLPEMGITASEADDVQTIDIVAILKWPLRTDDSERQLQFCHCLADMVGIALNTRHGACQESAIYVDHIEYPEM